MRLVIHGRVQGVGYRYSVLEQIESHQVIVRGEIRNLPNGTVEIIAQGGIEELKDVRRFASQGSERSKIRDIEEVITEISEFTFESFEVGI